MAASALRASYSRFMISKVTVAVGYPSTSHDSTGKRTADDPSASRAAAHTPGSQVPVRQMCGSGFEPPEVASGMFETAASTVPACRVSSVE